jgi:hypothetical protein
MRSTHGIAVAVTLLALGCDKGSQSQPSTSSEKSDKPEKSDESKIEKKKSNSKSKSKEDGDDDDDDDKNGSSGGSAKLPDKSAVSSAVSAFFAQYVDGASFSFYGDTFAPAVDEFLSLKSTNPTEMAKQARAFYTGKSGLKYTPQTTTLIVTPDASGDRETASVDVKMEWQYAPDKSWSTLEDQKVMHAHVATVEIVVGADGKWTSYGEPGLKRDTYQVVAPDGVLGAWTTPGETDNDDAKATLVLHKGDKVQDGFETLVVEMNTKGEVVARKIHQGGKDYWALDHGAVAVENPNGGTSAGEETYLQKVK